MKKIMTGIPVAVAALALSTSIAIPAQKESVIPDTPAGIKMKESLEVIDTGDAARIREFVSARFTPGFIGKFGKDRLFDVYYGFFEKYGGLELHEAQKSSPQNFVGVFRCRRTGSAFLFGLGVVSRAPHLIQGMTLLPMTHPGQPESLKKLTREAKMEMLGSHLDTLGQSEVFSGAVLVAKNGEVVFDNAYGLADRVKGVPNTVETRFNLASLNKMFTAVAVARLCERGRMSYDDPVANFLGPDWLPEKVSKKVLVKHLLSHTSGIGLGGEDDNLLYLESYVDEKFRRVDQYKALTREVSLKVEPGKEYSYSNIGYHLLGAVIEKVSGRAYDEFIRESVFKVAGMTRTGFDELDRLEPGTATGYVKELEDGHVTWKDNGSSCNWKGTPAGGAYSTVEDLLKFERSLTSGPLVSTATRDLLFTSRKELGAPAYGYGFTVREFDGHRKVGHTGGYVGINNHFSMFLDSGWTVIILSNIDLISGSAVSDIEFFISGLFDD